MSVVSSCRELSFSVAGSAADAESDFTTPESLHFSSLESGTGEVLLASVPLQSPL